MRRNDAKCSDDGRFIKQNPTSSDYCSLRVSVFVQFLADAWLGALAFVHKVRFRNSALASAHTRAVWIRDIPSEGP